MKPAASYSVVVSDIRQPVREILLFLYSLQIYIYICVCVYVCMHDNIIAVGCG